MSWPVLVFDIESIPDLDGLRALRGAPPEATDEQVYAAWLAERKEKGQSDFAPLHLPEHHPDPSLNLSSLETP